MKKLNLDKLKDKLRQLNGEKPKRQSIFWKAPLPDGDVSAEHEVYLLPWKDTDGYPFKERYFYYAFNGMKDNNGRFIRPPLTLRQFNEEDPVDQLISELWNGEDEDDKELAKTLMPTQAAFIPLIVKGEESLGPRLWQITSAGAYKRLTQLMLKYEEYGVLNDPENEKWLTVSVVRIKGKPRPLDKSIDNIDVQTKNKPLSEDQEQIDNWLETIPDLDDALKYQRYDYDGLSKLLEKWSETGNSDDDPDEGTEKNPKSKKNTKKKSSSKKGASQKSLTREQAMGKLETFLNDEEDEENEEDAA